MKKYFTITIWDCGPGRPLDSEYMLIDKSYKDNTIELSFDDGEKCLIMDPVNIIETETCFIIEKASKILWSFYCYGKPKSEDTLITIQYELLENGQIQIVEKGPFKRRQIISMHDRIAFSSSIRTQM